MKSIILCLGLLSSAVSMASEGPCANYAKFGAIRAYKAEMGTVQGSEGIEYSAQLTYLKGSVAGYDVVITDNNEDGDVWDVTYAVKVKSQGSSCKILSVTKL